MRGKYIEHLLSYLDRPKLKQLKIVVNAGNGGAGLVVDQLEPHLPFEFIKINHEPDGTFPNGVPNPMLEENRVATIEAIRKHGADLRRRLGRRLRPLLPVRRERRVHRGLLHRRAARLGVPQARARRAHRARSAADLGTLDMVESLGGKAVMSKSGHAFMKDVMREADAVYGGEMSAHHYFRRFAYCDSGRFPGCWSRSSCASRGKRLVGAGRRAHRALSRRAARSTARSPTRQATIERVQEHYEPGALAVDFTDGLSIEFDRWRFNLRCSNTEPLIRLNVESRGDAALMRERTAELLQMIGGEEAH